MDHDRFDDLTRVLATTTSRRQFLKLLGGGLLAGLLPRNVLAGGGNSNCANFCAQVFGANTPAAGKCTSDAAHGKGLCYTCGPAAPAGHPPLCGQVCCSAGQDCCNGTCTTLSTDVNNCGSCGNVCTTTVANATATCTNGVCGFTCNAGSLVCGNNCCGSDQGCRTNGTCCNLKGGFCTKATDCCQGGCLISQGGVQINQCIH